MKKIFFLCVLLFSTCLVFADALPDSGADALSRRLHAFNTYVARFHQVTMAESGRVLQRSDGRVWIKRPGKFRWVVNPPVSQTLVTDGRTLWVYDVALAQVVKRPLRTKSAITPAVFLSGSATVLAHDFLIVQQKEGAKTHFILSPKRKGFAFKKVRLTFMSGKLIAMIVMNPLNQKSVFLFSDIRLNQAVPNRLFVCVPKKGVDVLSE